MNNVSISIDIYAKKAFAMFSPSDGDLASATVFPMDIPAPFTAPGYINYTGVFTKVFNEMLLVNDISEANIRLAAPTEAIAIDYISVPNIGGKKTTKISSPKQKNYSRVLLNLLRSISTSSKPLKIRSFPFILYVIPMT